MTETAPPPAAAPAVQPVAPKPPMSTGRIVLIVVAAVLILGVYLVVRYVSGAVGAAVDNRVAQAQELQLYSSAAEGFSVEAPGEASTSSHDGNTDGGGYTQIQTTWKDGLYVIVTIDFSEYGIEDADLVLESSVDSMIAATEGAKLRESERVTFNGAPAIVGILDVPKTPGLRFVVALHNETQYAIIAATFSDDRDEDFLASFEFLD